MHLEIYLYKYHENLVKPLCNKVVLVFNLTQALFVYTTISMFRTLTPEVGVIKDEECRKCSGYTNIAQFEFLTLFIFGS